MSDSVSSTGIQAATSSFVSRPSSLPSSATTTSQSPTSTPSNTSFLSSTFSGSDVSSDLSAFSSDSSDGALTSRLTVTIILPTTTTASAASTQSVNHPGQDSAQSQPSHSNATKIAAISVSVFVGVLCIIGLAIFFVRCRRRSRPNHQRRAPSQNVDADTIEKYAGASEYAYSQYQHDPEERTGTLPILKSLFSNSRRSSRQSGEFGQYKDTDAPLSPFLNEDAESTHTPLAHAVSLGAARPFSEVTSETHFEHADLIPSAAHSPPKPAAHALPPIIIPEPKPLGRKPTGGKRASRRSSRRHSYRAIDAGDVSDVDSESMYSQASASTTYSALASSPLDRRASIAHVHGFPLAAIPGSPRSVQDKRDSSSTIKPGDVSRASSHILEFSYTASEAAAAEHDASYSNTTLEDPADESREDEDAVLVARLLQSRVRPELPLVARAESIVEHIERKGSIRPAYRASAGDELGRRGVRAAAGRAGRKSHHGAGVARSPTPEMPRRSLGEGAGL